MTMDAIDSSIQQIYQAPPPVPAVATVDTGPRDIDFAAIELLKAVNNVQQVPERMGIHAPMTASTRRFAYTYNGIWQDNTPHLDYNIQRRLSVRNPVLAMVLQTIIGQVVDHARKPEDERSVGFRVRLKERHKPLSQAAAKEIQYIEGVLFNGGIITEDPDTGEPGAWDSNYERQGDALDVAVRMLMRDSLVFDQTFISREGSPKRNGKRKHPVMFWKVEDGGLYRKTDRRVYSPVKRHDLVGKVKHVMLDPGVGRYNVLREYAWDEGDMFHRNPSSEFGSHGYGKSEVEMGLDVILGVLYGMQANKEWFTDSHIPHGLLNIIGNYGPSEVQALRTRLKQEVGMPGRYYEFPIIATPPGQGAGAQWIPFVDRTNLDMNFQNWITFCIAVFCGIYGIQPEEVGFSGYGRTGPTLSESDPESTFQQSQHKGLLPKVLWLVGVLNKLIVQQIDQDFELYCQGIQDSFNPQDAADAELDNSRLMQGWTLNQVRAARDQPPVVDPIDEELWASITEEFEKRWFENETVRQKEQIQEYKSRGGRLGKYPDAPASNAGMLEIYMQEHFAEEQAANEQMGQMAQDEAAGQRGQDEAEAQGARDQLSQMTQNEQLAQQQKEQTDQQAKLQEQAKQADQNRSDTLGIPGVDDAGMLRKGLDGNSSGKRRYRLRLGPRDS